MNLSQLQYAKAVAETNSFSRAAEICFVTQPTLSNAISQLEEELGGKLFARTTRKVDLTDFGRFLIPYLDNVLSAHSNLVNQAKSYQKTEQTMVRLGLSPLINTNLLSSIIEPFNEKHPDLTFILAEMNLVDLETHLNDEKLDFIFVPNSSQESKLSSLPFYKEDLLYIEKKQKKVSVSPTLTIEDIANETFLMVPNECGLAILTREIFASENLDLKEYSGKALSYQMLEAWAMLGIGTTLLPKSKISSHEVNAKLVNNKDGIPLSIGFEIKWNDKTVRNSNLKEFIKHFRNIVPVLVEGILETN